MEWTTDEELSKLMRKLLYTAVVGDERVRNASSVSAWPVPSAA
jgi:hypothetical protein